MQLEGLDLGGRHGLFGAAIAENNEHASDEDALAGFDEAIATLEAKLAG